LTENNKSYGNDVKRNIFGADDKATFRQLFGIDVIERYLIDIKRIFNEIYYINRYNMKYS
jgi:hypothetical protein